MDPLFHNSSAKVGDFASISITETEDDLKG